MSMVLRYVLSTKTKQRTPQSGILCKFHLLKLGFIAREKIEIRLHDFRHDCRVRRMNHVDHHRG